ncbi:MAG TPA: hypothetical protein VHT75_16430 [Acidimicrobiales bacterium]|jgi:hypothetical protein|nr:hypothetical protein [Acidimicrobiales bacterium]
MSATSVLRTPTRPPDSGNNVSGSRARFAGVTFVVFFIASVVASSVPANKAADAKWTAAYTGHSHQIEHLATGVFLVLAALSLLTLLATLWERIAQASAPARTSPVPLVAAGVSAACIAAGGVVMASISGTELAGKFPLPSADLLRFANTLGFALVAVGGMLAASFSVACLSRQGRAAGVLSRRVATFGLVVAVVILASVAFLPIAALWIWAIVITIQLGRRPALQAR